MGEYINKVKDMKFQSHEALNTIKSVLEEADKALGDKSYTIEDSSMSNIIRNVLTSTTGVGVGGVIGFAGLFFGGSGVGLSAAQITSALAAAGALIGGGMAVGVAVLAAPAVILGGLGIIVGKIIGLSKLKQEKNLYYYKCKDKYNAIISAIRTEGCADQNRIDLLSSLKILLNAAINDLEHDLGICN